VALILSVESMWTLLKNHLHRTQRAPSELVAGIVVLAVASLGLLWLGASIHLLVFLWVASAINIALQRSCRGARLQITPATVQIDQYTRRRRVIPLEEVSGFVTDDGAPRLLRGKQEPVPLSGILNRRERIWLRRLLKVHSDQRKAQLRQTGHDLDHASMPPEALQALRENRR